MQKIFFSFILVLLLFFAGFYLFHKDTSTKQANLKTYFKYSEKELKPLVKADTNLAISKKETEQLSEKIRKLIAKNDVAPTTASRIYAYYFTALSDAAEISLYKSASYKGSLNHTAVSVICEFLPESCDEIKNSLQTDIYSATLAQIVREKIKNRYEEEKLSTKNPELLAGEDYWDGQNPVTPNAGSWKTWIINSFDQIENVREAVANITSEQERAVKFWAGGKGTETPSGIWLNILDEKLKKSELTIDKELEIREKIAQAIADAFIVCWKVKFTYYTKRPDMRDSSIKTIIATPNFPSYTSGHATISAVAATILSHYFPREAKTYSSLAEEAKNSRLWSGIHFPVDNEAGARVGRKIGAYVVMNLN